MCVYVLYFLKLYIISVSHDKNTKIVNNFIFGNTYVFCARKAEEKKNAIKFCKMNIQFLLLNLKLFFPKQKRKMQAKKKETKFPLKYICVCLMVEEKFILGMLQAACLVFLMLSLLMLMLMLLLQLCYCCCIEICITTKTISSCRQYSFFLACFFFHVFPFGQTMQKVCYYFMIVCLFVIIFIVVVVYKQEAQSVWFY